MDANVKTALLEAGEEVTKVALEHALKIAKAYAESTEHTEVDNTIVSGVEVLYNAFVKDLAEKINPAD